MTPNLDEKRSNRESARITVATAVGNWMDDQSREWLIDEVEKALDAKDEISRGHLKDTAQALGLVGELRQEISDREAKIKGLEEEVKELRNEMNDMARRQGKQTAEIFEIKSKLSSAEGLLRECEKVLKLIKEFGACNGMVFRETLESLTKLQDYFKQGEK